MLCMLVLSHLALLPNGIQEAPYCASTKSRIYGSAAFNQDAKPILPKCYYMLARTSSTQIQSCVWVSITRGVKLVSAPLIMFDKFSKAVLRLSMISWNVSAGPTDPIIT